MTSAVTALSAAADSPGAPSGIRPEFARALHATVLREKPALVVEVGMANGISSLAICAALEKLGRGRLISIDPFQCTDWGRAGVDRLRESGLDRWHELREEPDWIALPALLTSEATVDLAYIDGWHTFDYTLVDFWYLDKLLRVGGVVAFNDCHLKSVHRVIRFVLSHRAYEEIDVGLEPEYGSFLPAIRRRITGRNGADRYLRKTRDWEPHWSYYADF